ncbi:unnamed protein product [Blepharisma stoltei]|uniref:Adipocyte plasma membrane-associated protein n=1 Tax=Blepharisma stoltei TaxID=1481888 RepID=A0AAU9IYF9_9CILI|nr:unnamed protein product [Blepharisma stoltei]
MYIYSSQIKMKIIPIVLIIVVSWLVYFVINCLDLFVNVKLHHDEDCEKIMLPLEAEDLAWYGNVIISGMSDLKASFYKHLAAKQIQKGSLIYIDPISKSWGYISMINYPENLPFNPIGFDIYNNKTLYAINTAFGDFGERIEVFSLSDSKEGIQAHYLRSIIFGNNWLGKLNDIAVLKEGHFYVSEEIFYPDTPEGRDHSFWPSIKNMIWSIIGNIQVLCIAKKLQTKLLNALAKIIVIWSYYFK